jgi:hypothetical protein
LLRPARPRAHQALGHGFHFARQGSEEAEFVDALIRGFLGVAQPQPAQPLGHTHHRPHQKPADHQQRDADNQHHKGGDLPEAAPPHRIALGANEAGIFQNHQHPIQLPRALQWIRILQPLPVPVVPKSR